MTEMAIWRVMREEGMGQFKMGTVSKFASNVFTAAIVATDLFASARDLTAAGYTSSCTILVLHLRNPGNDRRTANGLESKKQGHQMGRRAKHPKLCTQMLF